MAAQTKPLIDIPDDAGVHIKSAGAKNEKYVYKHVKYYRNTDGKPRNKSKAIGKYDAGSGKMVPNNNYYEIYNVDVSLPDITVWDYGYAYLILKVSNDIGLYHCLKQAFGERATDIIVMAAYIIKEGCIMDAIDDWQQRNYFPGYTKLLTSQSTSKIFAEISANQTHRFFKCWVSKALKSGSVCYDVTSVSSYSQGIPDVEYGYNRDGDDLGQFNIGMFCDEITKVPLYYNRYNGSLTDKTNLSHVLAGANDIGINHVKMILDGGFWSEGCIKCLDYCCEAFTIGMPASLKESEHIIATHGGGIEAYANELVYPHTYCVDVHTVIHDVPGKVLLYYDAYNHMRLCEELSSRIQQLSKELSLLKRFPKNKLKRYMPYFKLTQHRDSSGFDYAIDTDKIEKLRKLKGFFLLFTTDMESSPSDILYYYRAKDADEKLFSQIKVEMDGNRFRTHNGNTTDGKAFVIFIACIIRSYMLKQLSAFLLSNSTSLKKVFNQLSNIIIVTKSDGVGFRFVKALTKYQKSILSVFNAVFDISDSLG